MLENNAPFLAVGVVLLTKTNLFVESNTRGRFLGQEFFGIKENTFLFLESSFSLHTVEVSYAECCSPECRSFEE